jgi:hypothetical protein
MYGQVLFMWIIFYVLYCQVFVDDYHAIKTLCIWVVRKEQLVANVIYCHVQYVSVVIPHSPVAIILSCIILSMHNIIQIHIV